MPFGMDQAKQGSNYNRDKLKPGEHVCRIRDIREHNGFKGEGFFIDIEVVSGPSGAGVQASPSIYPKRVKPTDKMSFEDLVAREFGKIQRWVAACAGLEAARAGEINQTRYNSAIERPKSPLAGRLVIVNAVAHVNTRQENTVYYEFYPYTGEGQVDAAPAPVAAPPAPSAPAAPPAPPAVPARPAFEAAMEAAGYVVHPENPAYVYQVVGGQPVPNSVVTLDQLRSALGYAQAA